jgi:DNA (cytosine-5)-methyltransferase 1
MRFLSICSGIEAASVAWRPLGWEAVAFAEIEPFPCAVLAHHYPDVPNLGDMTLYENWKIDGPIDLVCGGTPCQSFSVAGLRAGMADPRGNLALVFLGIVDRFRPRWVVWENVPGVHSSWSDEASHPASEGAREMVEAARGSLVAAGLDDLADFGAEDFEEVDQSNDFDGFVAGLEELGYGVACAVLDAQYFGLAQRRERVFVVGHLGEWTAAAAVLFDAESLRGNPPPRQGEGQGPADTLACRARGGGGLGTDLEIDGGLIAGTLTRSSLDGSGVCGGDGREKMLIAGPLCSNGKAAGSATLQDAECGLLVAGTVSSKWAKRTGGPAGDECQNLVAHALRADGFDASEDGSGRGTPIVAFHGAQDPDVSGEVTHPVGRNGGLETCVAFDTTQITSGENRSQPRPGDPCHPLAAGAHPPGVVTTLAIRGRGDSSDLEYRTDGTANALVTPNGGRGGIGCGAIQHGYAVRRLTPRECERIQGFPDDYTMVPWRGGLAKDGPRYRALGNSWAVPCARWIGERIAAVDRLLTETL